MTEKQNRRVILLIDDDPDYSELTRSRLEAAGYQVSCASNGREALEFFEREHQPSLVIMDLEMPDKNGLTTLINMGVHGGKEEGEKVHVPVIVITGLESEKVRDIVMTQNVSAYIRKPYNSGELIHTIKQLIG